MNFIIKFYSYKPRVSFCLDLNHDALPHVGDIIRVSRNDLSDISKKRKKEIYYDLEFKVVKRTLGKFLWRNPNQYIWLIEVDFNDDRLLLIDKKLNK